MHKSANVQIKAKNIPEKYYTKALIVNIDTVSGKLYSAGGEFNNGWLKSRISRFGSYTVTIDSIPPKIVPLSINNHTTLNESKRIRFKISDNLAGIKSIEGFIDGKWALFDYDAKNDLITHYFDESRFEFNRKHQFLLKVADTKNNVEIYEASFWK